MTRKDIILIIVLTISYLSLYAQNDPNIDSLGKNAVSVNIFGTSIIYGISYERILSKNYTLDFGVGIIGIGTGIKYYFSDLRKQKILFYSGFTLNVSGLYGNTDVRIYSGKGFLVYFPIGLSYFGKKKLSVGLDIGPGTTFVKQYNGHSIIIYGNIKAGFRF